MERFPDDIVDCDPPLYCTFTVRLQKPLIFNGSAYGNRTRLSALRGPCPNRIDERAASRSLMLNCPRELSTPQDSIDLVQW